MTRIGAYLGLNVRFKTFDEGLAYLKTISASFGPHTPEQWRELNAAILKPQGGEWILHYDPRLAEPFKNTTPEMIAAGEIRCGNCSRRFPARCWWCAARIPIC